jgi:hypothetical protein
LNNAFTIPIDSSFNLLRFMFGLSSTPSFLQTINLYVGGILLSWEELLANRRICLFGEGGTSCSLVSSKLTSSCAKSRHQIIWNIIGHVSSNVSSLNNLTPNYETPLKPWPFALTCAIISMLLFQLIKLLLHLMYFGLNLSPSMSMEMPIWSWLKLLTIVVVLSRSCY